MFASAQATDFTGSASFTQAVNNVNPGLQLAANILSNSGAQGFVSAPLNFSLNLGDSFFVDLFAIRTLEPQLDADDLLSKPFSLDFSFGQGSTTVTGTTFAASSGGFSYGVMDFTGPASIDIGGGQLLTINLQDVTFSRGLGDLFTPGKSNGAVVTASFEVSAVPEPGSLAMILAGMVVVGGLGRRRQTSAT